jgi:hypothetical protein
MAVARPIPELAPVTNTVFPEIVGISSYIEKDERPHAAASRSIENRIIYCGVVADGESGLL